MHHFLRKSLLFLAPILGLVALTLFAYRPRKGGDLERIAYQVTDVTYNDQFAASRQRPSYFHRFDTVKHADSTRFRFLTIGDSFSRQFEQGYQSYLAEKYGPVLHFNVAFDDSPFQTAWSMAMGDVLDSLNVDYLVLQSVERHVTMRIPRLDSTRIMTWPQSLKLWPEWRYNDKVYNGFAANEVVRFPLNNLKYAFDDNAFDLRAYRVDLKGENLFTNRSPKQLLFLRDDLEYLKVNKKPENVARLNDFLNRLQAVLAARYIRLVFLPSPDKYGLYYPFISKQEEYPKPVFFDLFDPLPKNYLYLNSRQHLRELMEYKPNVYYYGDTHWSPVAAQHIAEKLDQLVRQSE